MSPAASLPQAPHPISRVLRLGGVILILASIAFWATAGAHRGWSQHRVPVSKTDEVTGLAYIAYEDRFVPGVEVLVGGAGLGLLLGAASLLIRRRS
jgi:hypothetical protein